MVAAMAGRAVTAEQKVEVETPLGPVWLWGRGDRGLPIMLVITGAFAVFDSMDRTGLAIEGLDVWRAHLPGNHCPELVATSVGAFAAAYSHALGSLFPDRPAVIVGLSTGALVGLALNNPGVRGMLLVEPPLRTDGVWPLRLLRTQAPPGSDEFLWNIFGVGPEALEARDYLGLLERLRVPSLVLVGQEALLPERETAIMPSLINHQTRDALDRHPMIQVIEAPGAGHNVRLHAPALFLEALLQTCRAAFGPAIRLAD